MTRRHVLAGLTATGLARPGHAEPVAGVWRMPGEDAPHQATLMQWPVNRQVHPDPVFLGMLQDSIALVANTIAAFEPVIMLMPASAQADARRRLSHAVEIWDIPTDDLWARDSGPVFVTVGDGGMAVVSLNFNGWGNKQTHEADGRIAARVAARMGLPLIDSGVVGEAGGLESDGAGMLMAHESSWVNDNRNPGLTRDEIEARLLHALGADRMIWAPGVRGRDITDDHIDARARFVEPGHVLIQMPAAPDPSDPFSLAAFETRDILAAAGLRLTDIPEAWDTRIRSMDFLAAYVNYYICNGAVIAAEFGDRETDTIAEQTLTALYPTREVIMLNVDPIGEVGGGIHCATQQLPAQ